MATFHTRCVMPVLYMQNTGSPQADRYSTPVFLMMSAAGGRMMTPDEC